MSLDWESNLTPHEKAQWDAWVDNARRGAFTQIRDSAFVMSLVPGEVDIKFAVELGLAIMMDKPILAVLRPGVEMPQKLKMVVDHWFTADIDTEEGKNEMMHQLAEFTEKLS